MIGDFVEGLQRPRRRSYRIAGSAASRSRRLGGRAAALRNTDAHEPTVLGISDSPKWRVVAKSSSRLTFLGSSFRSPGEAIRRAK
jgi:hypothetical protein